MRGDIRDILPPHRIPCPERPRKQRGEAERKADPKALAINRIETAIKAVSELKSQERERDVPADQRKRTMKAMIHLAQARAILSEGVKECERT